jgi:glycine cleavage system transcriptional repressor
MAVLGGEFAMIILVSGQQSEVKQLLVDLPGFAREAELELSVKETAEPRPNKEGRAYRIDTTSLDTPGIVHAVTDLLKTFGVSVDELETESTGAPFTGAPMFHMTIRAIVPTGVGIRDLRDALDAVARERDLDVNISPILPAPS